MSTSIDLYDLSLSTSELNYAISLLSVRKPFRYIIKAGLILWDEEDAEVLAGPWDKRYALYKIYGNVGGEDKTFAIYGNDDASWIKRYKHKSIEEVHLKDLEEIKLSPNFNTLSSLLFTFNN